MSAPEVEPGKKWARVSNPVEKTILAFSDAPPRRARPDEILPLRSLGRTELSFGNGTGGTELEQVFVIQVSVPTNLPAEEVAAVLAQVRAAIGSIPAEAGRFVVELAPPAS